MPLTVHPVPFASQRVVPWRNGGGTTREIAIDPPDADVGGAFRWRVSRAHVAADGPFSRFPGIDRSLWLVAGDGIELDVDGVRTRLDAPGARCDFAGECAVHGRLLGGAIDDLNVMVDRARGHGQSTWQWCGGRGHARTAPAGTTVVVALTAELAALDRRLAPGDALRIEADQPFELVLRTDGTRGAVLVATFTAAPRQSSA